jgi:bifunctional non-homologous end joining protein LigD
MPRLVRDGSLRVDGRTVQVSSVDKPFFPDAGLTNGVDGHGFFQQGASDHFPDWIRTVTVERRGRGGTVDHVVCDDAATLLYLVNLATVTFHAWTAKVEHLDRPDMAVFDLDPDPGQGLDVVRAAARAVKAACEELGLVPFVQTSGSRGYHVVVPLQPGPDVEVVRQFANQLAELVAARDPERLTVEWRKAKRDGRLLLDTARNGYAQTIVAPYSVRARPQAPVATPIDWSELGRVEPRTYTVANLRRRLARKPDPWAAMPDHAVPFDAARTRLDQLRARRAEP